MATAQANPFVARLSHGAALSSEDVELLDALVAHPATVPARTELVAQGDPASLMRVVLDGYACRFKILPDGRRAIVALMLPGDICDLHVEVLGRMDHAIATISECRVAQMRHEAVEAAAAASPAIARALWWSTLAEGSISREWLTNMGRRRSDRQMAHLFCEIHARLAAVGLADGESFPFPVTQEELADMLGIAPVHAHRVLQGLRGQGLVADRDRRVTIPDLRRLRAFAGFDPDYLHLDAALYRT